MSWHGAVGLWIAIGLLFVSATGLTWSQYAGQNVSKLRETFGWATPTLSTAVSGHHAATAAHDHHPVAATGHHHGSTPKVPAAATVDVGVDAVLRAARGKGLSDPVELAWPKAPGSAYTVSQIQRSWPEKQDAVAVDPATGVVVDEVRFAEYPLMAKLARWGVDLHMGVLFGPVSQVVQASVALALICMIVWGYRMWWQRRPNRDRACVSRWRAEMGVRACPGWPGSYCPSASGCIRLSGASLTSLPISATCSDLPPSAPRPRRPPMDWPPPDERRCRPSLLAAGR